MKEAVAKMKAELGDDAVILHTKKYKEGGLLGLGSKEMVEITAAIEDEKPAPKKEPEIPQRTTPIMPTSVLTQYKTNGTAEGVAIAEREANPPPKTTISSSNINSNEDKSPNASSMMSPTVNQATSLEEAMKPGQKPIRPDPPMPYDDDGEITTTPYELDISSKADLNTKADTAVSPDMQSEDKQFVHSKSELDESIVEDEPDENVYAAEPQKNEVEVENNSNDQSVQNQVNVQDNDDTIAAIDSSTTQVGVTQPDNTNEQPDIQTTPQPQQPIQSPQPVQNLESQNNPPLPQPQIQPTQVQSNQSNQSNQSMQAPFAQSSQPVSTQQPQQSSQPNQSAAQPVNNSQSPAENEVPQSTEQNPTNQANSAEQTASNQQQLNMNQPLTPAQLAQAQAMMMAQFNQMQMAQAMQQAVAQAQAQAQEQVRQAYLQAQAQVQNQNQSNEQTERPSQKSSVSPETNQNDQESQAKIKKLENEIAQMKALLAQVIGKDANHGLSLHEALRRQEVSEEILNDMAAHAEAGETLADSQSREAKTTLVKYLKENINFSDGIKLNRHGVRIVALLGTTGVGKTTTLAKIAAKFVLEQGITAALITADTYRISAVEQLRTYSDILGLPLEIVYSPAELSKAINKHRNKDLILIDTAGRSQHNDYQMKELQEFLAANQRIEKHIVLSTTTKISDANDILKKFAVCEPDKIIFTKTDETASVGLVVNLLYNQKLSISYVTNGQSVPDDITPANAEILADLLLRKNF